MTRRSVNSKQHFAAPAYITGMATTPHRSRRRARSSGIYGDIKRGGMKRQRVYLWYGGVALIGGGQRDL